MSGSPNAVLVHAVWTLAPGALPLTEAIVERLTPYATRWAKTLGVHVWAIGGVGDTLHLLLDAPVDRAVQTVTNELQAATARFANNTLGLQNFVWHSASYEGVGANEKAARIGYIHTIANHLLEPAPRPDVKTGGANTDEIVPDWLREALADAKRD